MKFKIPWFFRLYLWLLRHSYFKRGSSGITVFFLDETNKTVILAIRKEDTQINERTLLFYQAFSKEDAKKLQFQLNKSIERLDIIDAWKESKE